MSASPESALYLNLPVVVGPPTDEIALQGDLARALEPTEELPETEYIFRVLASFPQLLERTANGPQKDVPIVLENLPRVASFVRSADSDEVVMSCPPALPFLESAYSAACKVFRVYQRARGDSRIIGRQTCLGLCHLLKCLEEIEAGKIRLDSLCWKAVGDGHHSYSADVYRPSEVISLYFTPGIDRFALGYMDTNPRGRNPNPCPTYSEFRFDIRSADGNGGFKLEMDISVRQWSIATFRGQGERPWHSIRDDVDKIDFLFGPGCHHVLIGRGTRENCAGYIYSFIQDLGLGRLIKDTSEIPARAPKRSR